MTQIQKFQNTGEIAQFVKSNSDFLFFDNQTNRQKFASGLILDLYNDSKKADNYASSGIDLMDVVMLHYKAATAGLSHINGDFSIVKFGGKNPRPVAFTSYQKERDDVLKSEIVAEFFPQTVYNGSKVVQLDTLQWRIEPQKKSARKLNERGQFDLTNVMGFAFTLVTTSGRKFTYFTTKEEIFFEIGKDEKTLFMYRGANGETMFWKFVMRKLLKWLPISLCGVKKWEEAEIVSEFDGKATNQMCLNGGQNFAENSAFIFEKPEKQEIEDTHKEEKENVAKTFQNQETPKKEKEGLPPLTLGSEDFTDIQNLIAEGKISTLDQIKEKYTVPQGVAAIIQEML